MKLTPALFFITAAIWINAGCHRDKTESKPVAFDTFIQSIPLASCTAAFDSVNAIRQQVAALSKLGYGRLVYAEQADTGYFRLGAKEQFDLLRQTHIIGNCGVINSFLCNVYKHLGYCAYLVDLGFPANGLSHIAVVVVVRQPNGRPLHTLQCAHYNITYTDDAGEAFDFYALRAGLQKGDVRRLEGGGTVRILIDKATLRSMPGSDSCLYFKPVFKTLEDDTAIAYLQLNRNPESMIHINRCILFGEPLLDSLAARGFPRQFDYLLCVPFAEYGRCR